MTDATRHTCTVSLSPERAFSRFTERLGSWWPPEYTWSQHVLETIGIEPRQGGLCFERGPDGFRCDWGRVLAWEPPRRLLLAWQIDPSRAPQPDPAKASEVDVRFEPDARGTRVELEHRAFARHGDAGAAYREALASPQGWPYILDRFRNAGP
jgi:uncharacterized protein YndB with AHSA1/START domain